MKNKMLGLVFCGSIIGSLIFIIPRLQIVLRYLLAITFLDVTNILISPDALESQSKELIPKIIHQTWRVNKITDFPNEWIWSQTMCRDLHLDYKYMFWTDEDLLNFIRENYSWFYPTFQSYAYPIQRVDAARLFFRKQNQWVSPMIFSWHHPEIHFSLVLSTISRIITIGLFPHL